LGLGILGIFLPLLPTTPFLLLSAACYTRSSDKFYKWLVEHRWLGPYIKNYREGKGIPGKAKIMILTLLWVTISFSVIFMAKAWWLKAILLLIAAGVSWHVLSLNLGKTRKSIHQAVIPSER
jgi:uncharacterized membrane protein YbaN (DUF454 family)